MWQRLFGRTKNPITMAKIKETGPKELKKRIDSGEPLLLLDVRSPVEYQHGGHIPGARLLPLSALWQRMSELPKDQPIICICRSGNKSKVACEQLDAAGFEDVTNLKTGMIGWQMASLFGK